MAAQNAIGRIYRVGGIILALVLGTINLNGQPFALSDSAKTESVDLLNGKQKGVFKNIALNASKIDQFTPLFSKSIDSIKILCVNGFKISDDAALEFYQTAIAKPTVNDGGISTLNSIALFTDQIPQGRWLESGWKAVSNDYLYFVKMISDKKSPRYFEFTFFYIDNKLSFSVLQCPLQFSQKYKHLAEENYLSLVSN